MSDLNSERLGFCRECFEPIFDETDISEHCWLHQVGSDGLVIQEVPA